MNVYNNTQQKAAQTHTTIQPCTNCSHIVAKTGVEQRLLLQILDQLLEQPTTQSLVPTPFMPEAMRLKGNSSVLLPQTKKTQKSSDCNYQMKDMKKIKQIVVQHHCHRCTSQSFGSLKNDKRNRCKYTESTAKTHDKIHVRSPPGKL